MNKYIFYENRIYNLDTINNECEDAIHKVVRFDSLGVEYRIRFSIDTNWTDFNKNEWVEIKQHKIVENFEDLIEVGDLIHCAKSPNGWYESVISIAENRVDTNVSFFRKNIDEIWKRVNNTFVKVCHKENGKWCID